MDEKNLKCIRGKCDYFFSSDNYFETCQLISKYVLTDKCYGLAEIPNKKEEIICKIAKLTEELNRFDELENLIKENQ